MALTKDDLQAIREIAREEVQRETAPIKADVSNLKADVAELKVDVAELKVEMRAMNQGLAVIESKVLAELQILKEGMTGWQQRNLQIDTLEHRIEDHGHRIWALEEVVKAK